MMHKSRDSRDREWQEIEHASMVLPIKLVALETIGNCNRVCAYCPVSSAPKRMGRLEEEAIYSVINQLAMFDYHGKFVFHFYNEPLLDKRIFSFVEYCSEFLPYAKKLLTTNGDFLNEKKLKKLLNSDFDVAISAHDIATYNKGQLLKKTMPFDRQTSIQIRPFYKVGDGSKSVRITNRGGSVDMTKFASEETQEAGQEGCNRLEFNIDYLGNVHPCCMDFSNGYIVGNVKHESLKNIWQKTKVQFKEHFFGYYSKQVCLKCAKLT